MKLFLLNLHPKRQTLVNTLAEAGPDSVAVNAMLPAMEGIMRTWLYGMLLFLCQITALFRRAMLLL